MIRQSFLLRSKLLSFSGSAGPALRNTALRSLATSTSPSGTTSYTAASSNADLFDEKFSIAQAGNKGALSTRSPIKPFPQSPRKAVPPHIVRPPYAKTGQVPYSQFTEQIVVHDADSADLMRHAARLARRTLDLACSAAEPGVTSDEVDTVVHEAIIAVRERRRDDLIMEKEQ
jgi:hypothetical protein